MLALARPQPKSIFNPAFTSLKGKTCRKAGPNYVQSQRIIAVHGVGKDITDSWLDLAGFVSTNTSGSKTPYDRLADGIGRDCYLDVAGWHLYLKDVKIAGGPLTMAQGIAAQLGAKIQSQGGKISETDITAVLSRVPIKLGQGKATLPLLDLMPGACVRDLLRVCEDNARDL